MIMENHNAIREQAIKHLRIAKRQLNYYHENELCVIQDRDDVRYLAEEFGDEQLAVLTDFPNVFDKVCEAVVEQESEDTF